MAGAGPTFPAAFWPSQTPYDTRAQTSIHSTPKTWFSQDIIILNYQVEICQHYINLFALALYFVNLNFLAGDLHGIKVSQFTFKSNSKYIFSAYFLSVSVQSIFSVFIHLIPTIILRRGTCPQFIKEKIKPREVKQLAQSQRQLFLAQSQSYAPIIMVNFKTFSSPQQSLPIPPSLSPRHPLIFLSLQICIVWTFHINGIMQYMVFCNWLL